ncbi:hypothetical protein INR49_023344 [Caranx melampygus]|nr:hypothetical protein INR49_023344 [Caranx melampygus]
MTCTRVLHAIGGYPPPGVMPDLAACLSLTRRQPIHQLLSTSTLKPAKRHCQSTATLPRTHSPHHFPSSSPPCSLSSPVPPGPRSCFRRDSGSNVNKKRVVFADAKGLALTAVRLFIPEPTSTPPTLLMKPSPAKLQGQQSPFNSLQRYKLRLAFPQPILDFKAFLARLREMNVQLESCSISDRTLSGKVCVSNISIEKAVHIRVTFDSWRSHRDIPCTFLQQQRSGGSDIGVYAFELSLPQNIDPKERIEFACPSGRGLAQHHTGMTTEDRITECVWRKM